MKNNEDLSKDKKTQSALNADKNNTSGKEENKLQDGNKKNNEKTIEPQGKKSTDQDSKKEKSFSKK